MAKHTYTIASQEGADRYGAEIGTEHELDLSVDEARAVVAAGWVEAVEENTKQAKEAKT